MEDNKKVLNVPIEDILPNRFQPRIAFDEKELNELSNSILRYGVIQPIVLRRIGDKYEIIAGERRYKATVLAGLKTIPAIINDTDDNTSAEIALLENLQRKDLSAIEEAQSYKKLIERGFTQDEIASKLGISQSSVANKLRLLNLPKRVQNELMYGKISERHARCLLSLNNENMQLELLDKIINNRLTVKQTEEEINEILNKNAVEKNIPEQIQKIMDLKPIYNEEYLRENTPQILEIEDNELEKDNNENKNVINPFQVEQFENNIKRIEEDVKNKSETYYDEIINNDLKNNNIVLDEPKIEEESNNYVENKNVLPQTIGKIREYIDSINDGKITTSEMDLPNKYQIIIEIEKDV